MHFRKCITLLLSSVVGQVSIMQNIINYYCSALITLQVKEACTGWLIGLYAHVANLSSRLLGRFVNCTLTTVVLKHFLLEILPALNCNRWRKVCATLLKAPYSPSYHSSLCVICFWGENQKTVALKTP